MGDIPFTEYDYDRATSSRGISFSKRSDGSRKASKRVTEEAERQSIKTGKLDPAVDPAVMVIRRSLPRFKEVEGGYVLTMGWPMNIESTCDTTGSMGDNADIAMELLPETYGMVSKVLPDYDPQFALGIFGDVCDNFVINRPQFEMQADKIVDYVTKLVPEGNGGDAPEDPQYAMFGAAYLTDASTNRLGIKGYHFVITDAGLHGRLDPNVIERIYGEDVWKDLADNGFPEITRTNLPDMDELMKALNQRVHAFFIGVGRTSSAWYDLYDDGHRIEICNTRCLPQIEAAIIGLTEGTLEPIDIEKFLKDNQVSDVNIHYALPGLKLVPFAVQRMLEEASGHKIPQKGDIFATKQDIEPIGHVDDISDSTPATTESTTVNWL